MREAAEVRRLHARPAHLAQELAVGCAEALGEERVERWARLRGGADAGEGGREKGGDEVDAVVSRLAAAVTVEDAEARDGRQAACGGGVRRRREPTSFAAFAQDLSDSHSA